jgi:hypothetical protein
MTDDHQSHPDTVDPETRDFLIEYLKDAPEVQLRDSVDLDNKVIGLFAAASVVIGLTTLGSIGKGTDALDHWVTAFLIGAVASYLLAGGAALVNLWPVEQWRSLHADQLWAGGKGKPVAEIKDFLLESIQTAYRENKTMLARKGWASLVLMLAVITEIACIGVALILTRF